MKTHPLNTSYLVVGLVFLAVAGTWALHAAGVVDGTDARWLLPLLLVVAGGVGLAASAARGLFGRSRADSTDPFDTDTTEGDLR